MLFTKWQPSGNILAFPHGWQTPAKTEQWVFEQCTAASLFKSPYVQLVCFPWATLIDLLHHGNKGDETVYLNALKLAPPRNSLIRATVCQHIYAKEMLPWFKRLKITDLYWPHAVQKESKIEGIRIHPFPLYPVRCLDNGAKNMQPGKALASRRYLYCFIGAYEPELYLSPVRRWIFDLLGDDQAYIERREEWHYLKKVYGEQISGIKISPDEKKIHDERSRDYVSVLADTVFSLCPSGSGPNSIRLWESLGFGCIPVVLSDELRLPGNEAEWRNSIIRVPETEQAVKQLPDTLKAIARDSQRLLSMQDAGKKLWLKYGENGPSTIFKELTIPKKIHELVTDKQRKELADSQILLVYQMGKVGSTTVTETLTREFGADKVIQAHFLSDHFKQRAAGQNKYKWHLQQIERVEHLMRKKQQKRIKLITLVRDPVSRNVSDFFQNPQNYLPLGADIADLTDGQLLVLYSKIF
jgi:hypothetical protein